MNRSGGRLATEVAARAKFTSIRYAQCWEDADVLLEALDVQPGESCLSIASAGDNSLALLTRDPARVVAVDLSSAQLAALALRVAAYRNLSHEELLELIGSRSNAHSGHRREDLYRRCRSSLDPEASHFWDHHIHEIRRGIGSAGKFEGYFALFRRWILPWVHSQKTVQQLLAGGDQAVREAFYAQKWDTWRWRWMFRLFFSRLVMGRLGRDPSFFQYVEGSVADKILQRTRDALTRLNPAENPYVHWILTGRHGAALPYALRPEHFETIRENLHRLEWSCQSVEDRLKQEGPRSFHRFNLSDIFEYMSWESSGELLESLANSGRPGGRLVYWNMLVPRSRPESLAGRLLPLKDSAKALHRQDKAFFYSDLVIEEICR